MSVVHNKIPEAVYILGLWYSLKGMSYSSIRVHVPSLMLRADSNAKAIVSSFNLATSLSFLTDVAFFKTVPCTSMKHKMYYTITDWNTGQYHQNLN